MWKLKSFTTCPPGEFSYEQTDGIQHKFPPNPDILDQAKKVAEFRRANGLRRSSTTECMEDIIIYTCQRLGNNPRYCHDTEATVAASAARAVPRTGGCGSCGHK